MRFVRGVTNPNGMPKAELFLLTGNATLGPVDYIEAKPQWNLSRCTITKREAPFRLRVLHFNDLHGFITKIKHSGTSSVFSRMVFLVRHLRQRYLNNPDVAVLFAAGGDEQVGSLFDELLTDDQASYRIHAGYHAYSAAGVDVGVIGNHDLDRGAGLLAHAIQQDAHFPILSANAVSQHHLNWLGYPAALFRVKEIRIGIIGLTTAGQLKCYESDVIVFDPLTTLQNLLPTFKPFCDIILILSHLGYSSASNSAIVKPIGDVELAEALEYCEVDLIIGGHTHHALNADGLSQENIVNGIPIVQAGTRGQYLGSVDITIRRGTAAVSSVRLMPISDLPVDQTFEENVVKPLLEEARPILDTPLGTLADDPGLSTVFIRNYFAAEEVPLVNFITDGMVARCWDNVHPVDLAMVDASIVKGGLPRASQVTLGMWLRLMPFTDTIQLCSLTGSQLKQLLNDNACRIDLPGEPHTERGFLHFSREVRYTINIIEPVRAAGYASDITVQGIPLEEQLEKTFVIACNSFIRRTCLSWEKLRKDQLPLSSFDEDSFPRFDTGLLLSRELMTYVRLQGGIRPETGA
jgi:2',3'-cyclic-nucleotide 2'-phosphodiesterase (5'-nucleotidase family)